MRESASNHESGRESGRQHDLSAALREVYAGRMDVPAARDAEVRRQVAAHFAAARAAATERRSWRMYRWAAAAAAALVIAGSLWMLQPRTPAPVPSSARPGSAAQRPRGDFDGNGIIDILDAFGLARTLDAGRAAGGFDLNGDLVVDGSDVEVIAMQAVALSGAATGGAGTGRAAAGGAGTAGAGTAGAGS